MNRLPLYAVPGLMNDVRVWKHQADFFARERELALSEEMAAMIADARLVVIDTCGHMAPLERPDAVIEAMADCLRRADA